MAYYIDRDALFSYLIKSTGFRTNCEGCTDIDCLDCIAKEGIKRFPTLAVAPVRHGRWVKQDDYSCCSQCGQSISDGCVSWFKYCPSCGAKMEVGDKNDE